MKIPVKYIVKNFTTRKLTSVITIFGVALVVLIMEMFTFPSRVRLQVRFAPKLSVAVKLKFTSS